jgi:hypothetical protein
MFSSLGIQNPTIKDFKNSRFSKISDNTIKEA